MSIVASCTHGTSNDADVIARVGEALASRKPIIVLGLRFGRSSRFVVVVFILGLQRDLIPVPVKLFHVRPRPRQVIRVKGEERVQAGFRQALSTNEGENLAEIGATEVIEGDGVGDMRGLEFASIGRND